MLCRYPESAFKRISFTAVGFCTLRGAKLYGIAVSIQDQELNLVLVNIITNKKFIGLSSTAAKPTVPLFYYA